MINQINQRQDNSEELSNDQLISHMNSQTEEDIIAQFNQRIDRYQNAIEIVTTISLKPEAEQLELLENFFNRKKLYDIMHKADPYEILVRYKELLENIVVR